MDRNLCAATSLRPYVTRWSEHVSHTDRQWRNIVVFAIVATILAVVITAAAVISVRCYG